MTKMISVTVAFVLGFAAVCDASVRSEFDLSVINSPKCVKGPAVWCRNFTTAADCNAVVHCVQTVWTTEVTNINDDNSCQPCVIQLDQIRRTVNENTTKELMEQALDHVCELSILGKIFRQSCVNAVHDYVHKYLNELLDLLSSSVNSQSICKLLGFCDLIKAAERAVNPPQSGDDEVAVVRYKNVVLYLPADYLNVHEFRESDRLVGSEKCTWGPSYWCGDIRSSKECNVTSHCVQTVWSSQRYEDDDDDVCKICEDMGRRARDQVLRNGTQEELRRVFEGSCKQIPIGEIRDECVTLVDQYVPELTGMLVSEMSPTAVCTVAGLCNSERIDSLLARSPVAPSVYDDCTKCTAAIVAVERYLQNTPKDAIADKLSEICGELSTFSEVCSAIVESRFDDIYSTLAAEAKPTRVCHFNGMCQSLHHTHDKNAKSILQSNVNALLATSNDDLPCDLCVQFVEHSRRSLVANTSEAEFTQALKGFCQQSGKLADDCVDVVDRHVRIIFKFLTDELEPTQFCKEVVGLCPRSNFVSGEGLSLVAAVPAAPTMLVASGDCQFCKMVIQFVQQELQQPEYENDIEKAMEGVCYLVPSGDRIKCKAFVDQYEGDLIRLITTETDPGVVCQMLNVCHVMQPVKGTALCPICEYVMHFVQEELNDPAEQKDIEQVVLKICELVPRKETEECEKFVDQYSALILAVLSQELDPSLVCPAMKLCPAVQTPETRCKHCLHLLQNLVDRLDGDRVESRIQNELRHIVPSKRDDTSAVAVELNVTNHEDVVEMMMIGFSAPESCIYLHFCTPNMLDSDREISDELDNLDSRKPMLATEQKVTDTPCEVCQLMVRLYEDKLTSNVSVKELEDALSEYCEKIEHPELRSKCTHFVLRYVPRLVDLLEKDVKPKDLCGLAKLCALRPTNTFSIETTERCRMCEAIIGALQGMARDPYVVDHIVHKMEKMCSIFGEKERETCAQIVVAIVPSIDSVILGLPSWLYCAKIDMCPYRDRLIDRKVCETESSWCQDKETAVLCDKLKHCRENVWKSD